MNITLGTADRKKVAILGGLLVVAAVVFWMNSSTGDVPSNPPAKSGAIPKTTTPLVAPRRIVPSDTPARARTGTVAANRTLQEFRPSLKPKRPEDRPDPMSIDPTLRLDVLAKIQQVNVEGVHRNVFDFGQTPPPPVEAAKPGGKKPAIPNPVIEAQANLNAQPVQPPPPPPPPKIPWKFYGFLAGQGKGPKQAFFLDGDDIHVVGEGDVVKKRFKIVKIGVNSVVVEDMDFHNQQTLPLEEAPAG